MVSEEEVQRHDSRRSCWVVIDGNAYDVTEYIEQHPGGPSVLLRYAGKDATEEYEPIHPPGTIENTLPKDKHMGPVEGDLQKLKINVPAINMGSEDRSGVPPLSTIQNLDEFELAAKKVLSRKAWVFYYYGVDSLSSLANNRADWKKIHFRPRILRNVAKVSTKCSIMGHASSLPFFIAPAAQARLGHPDGEVCLARGAARFNIPQCTSTVSSVDHDVLARTLQEDPESKGGALLFQLYVPVQKQNARHLIAKARRLKCTALVITVDSAVIGKREEDDRYKAELDIAAGVEIPRTTNPSGPAPVLRGAHSSTLEWADLPWIREAWGNAGQVVIKGIQTAEDALMAAQIGVDAIYLSNHGGRQLDFAPSSIRTLLEIRKFCPDVLNQLDVYLDGGVSRGTDVLKALCLGAKGVGLGRPFMYALSAYGTEGVCKAISILSDEIETSMRLMGVTDLSQLDDFYVNASVLEDELPRKIRQERVHNGSKL